MTQKIIIFTIAIGLFLVSFIFLIKLIKEKRKNTQVDERFATIRILSEEELRKYYHKKFDDTIRMEAVEYLNSLNDERKVDLTIRIRKTLRKEGINLDEVMNHFFTYLDLL